MALTEAQKKALRELFGEVKDPRFTIFNGMTNLSSLARTTAYLAEIKAKNTEIITDIITKITEIIADTYSYQIGNGS